MELNLSMSTDVKIISATILVSTIILAGGVFFALRQPAAPAVNKDQIVTEEGLHWHPRLTITIKGKKQEIPAEIGLGAIHEKIHTHVEDAKDGIIHMEMSGLVTKDETKLGNFFKIWGKEFNATKILDKTNGTEGKVKIMVNGKENKRFENYQMRDNDQIEILFE